MAIIYSQHSFFVSMTLLYSYPVTFSSRILKIIITVIFFGGLGYYSYYKWRQTKIYEDKITVTAVYMMYACGDCSIDMKVYEVNNKDYEFIVGQEIFPTPRTKTFEELCHYVGSANYEASVRTGYSQELFTLIGRLHKHAHGFPIFNCSETPFFTVEKIKCGADGQWKDF